MEMEEIARYAFVALVIIAIIAGIAVGFMAWNSPSGWFDDAVQNINGWILLIMLILGIIVGITSITAKEVTPFLIATIALVVAANANIWSPLGQIHEILDYWATAILWYIVAFAAPAAVIIAIKSVFAMAREK